MDPTAKLIDCGQDPNDVELACGVVIHVRELMEDRIIALTEEGSSERNFVVLVIAFMFAVCGVLDLEDELRFVVKSFQRGLYKLEVFAVIKGGTYGGNHANNSLVQIGISTGSEFVGGDDHLPLRVVLAFKWLAGPVRARACVRAGAGGSVGSTHVSGCRKCSGIGHGD